MNALFTLFVVAAYSLHASLAFRSVFPLGVQSMSGERPRGSIGSGRTEPIVGERVSLPLICSSLHLPGYLTHPLRLCPLAARRRLADQAPPDAPPEPTDPSLVSATPMRATGASAGETIETADKSMYESISSGAQYFVSIDYIDGNNTYVAF
jgi:hypothetical protein